jgi:hypothetical protein
MTKVHNKKILHRRESINARMHYCTTLLDNNVIKRLSKVKKVHKRHYSKSVIILFPDKFKGVVNLSKTFFANLENNLEITSQKLTKIVKDK